MVKETEVEKWNRLHGDSIHRRARALKIILALVAAGGIYYTIYALST